MNGIATKSTMVKERMMKGEMVHWPAVSLDREKCRVINTELSMQISEERERGQWGSI